MKLRVTSFLRAVPSLLVLPTTVLVALLTGTPAVHAQALGTTVIAVDSAVAFSLAAAPAPGSWRVNSTAGFRFEDGRVDSRGYALGVNAAYTTAQGILLRVEGDWQRAEARPAPDDPMYIIDDTRYAAFSAARMITGPVGVMAVTSWRKDVPLDLESRVLGQVGPYLAVSHRPDLAIATVPMVGWGRQTNARSGDAEGIVHLGGIQTITWKPNPFSTIEAYVSGHRVIDDADDYSVTVNASVTGALSRHLGVKIFYRLYEEGIRPPGTPERQHTVGAGLNIVFPSLGSN